jgi:hypothetical protein
MGRMADVIAPENAGRDAPDGQHLPALGELLREDHALRDLEPRREAIRRLRARVGRDDVPEQNRLREPEFGEDTVDDRGRRFGRSRPRQLALGGERNARNAGAPIARRLADEQQRGIRT